jgi:hypothetical protein
MLRIAKCEESPQQLMKLIESLSNQIKDQCQKI